MYPSEWLITAPAGQGMASGGMGRGGYEGGNNQGVPRATKIAATKSKAGAMLAVGLEHASNSSSANHGSTTATHALSR